MTDPANLFAAVVEGAGAGIVVVDLQGRIIIANNAFCDLLGYSKDELAGRDARSLADAVNDHLFQELLSGARTGYTVDRRYRHKNGDAVWGRVTVTLIRETAGDFVIAIVEDITAKRFIEQAAEEARRAHERYALVARATNDVIWDWDAEHGTIIWNDALQTMFGYAPDQIDNRLQWWDSHLHPDDRERVVAGINDIIEKGGSSWTDEYRFERADGSFTEVLDRGYIARSEDGTPIRMIGAMLDVTERKRAERIATFMAEASAVLASSLDYNATLARVAELTVPVLADWCFVDLRTGDETYERLGDFEHDLCADLVREVIIAGVPKLIEHVDAVVNSLGIRSVLIVPLVVVPGDRPLGALTLAMSHSRRTLADRDRRVVEDVARRAAMAIEHARLYDDAQKANLAKDEFLAILSHELSTPLTIILGWSGILSRGDVSQEELLQGVESIRAGALAQAQLIDDVLDLSRVTTGKLRLDMQPVSIGQLVSDSLTAVRVAATAKRIDLVAPDTTAAGTVLGDGNRLRQVVWNLLTNAIKFTPPGGKVAVELENTPATVRLIVTDSGKGIARDFLAHVFEPFRQGDASTTRTHGGLGLGLAIVRYLVEGHGGTVAAFSDGLDRGARFVVELPSVPSSSDAAADKHLHSPRTELAGVRVLFVDDQADARDLARVIFSNAGAETTTTASANEALEALDRMPADIVVADIAMPEVDGYALITEIRRRDLLAGRHTPAIAATAYRSNEDRDRALAAGFDAYVKKPMDAATLTSTVASVIASSRIG